MKLHAKEGHGTPDKKVKKTAQHRVELRIDGFSPGYLDVRHNDSIEWVLTERLYEDTVIHCAALDWSSPMQKVKRSWTSVVSLLGREGGCFRVTDTIYQWQCTIRIPMHPSIDSTLLSESGAASGSRTEIFQQATALTRDMGGRMMKADCSPSKNIKSKKRRKKSKQKHRDVTSLLTSTSSTSCDVKTMRGTSTREGHSKLDVDKFDDNRIPADISRSSNDESCLDDSNDRAVDGNHATNAFQALKKHGTMNSTTTSFYCPLQKLESTPEEDAAEQFFNQRYELLMKKATCGLKDIYPGGSEAPILIIGVA